MLMDKALMSIHTVTQCLREFALSCVRTDLNEVIVVVRISGGKIMTGDLANGSKPFCSAVAYIIEVPSLLTPTKAFYHRLHTVHATYSASLPSLPPRISDCLT